MYLSGFCRNVEIIYIMYEKKILNLKVQLDMWK